MSKKQRRTVTVEPDLIRAGHEAVAAGLAGSLSAWVNTALAERVSRDRRLAAMAEAVAACEKEFGVISDVEAAEQLRADRAAALVQAVP